MISKWIFIGLILAFSPAVFGRIHQDGPRAFHRVVRARALAKLDRSSALLVFGGGFRPSPEVDLHQFRQNSNFHYLTGISQKKSAILLYWDGGQPIEKLYLTPLSPWMKRWVEPRLAPGKKTARLMGFQQVLPLKNLGDDLQNLIKLKKKKLYTNWKKQNPQWKLPGLQKKIQTQSLYRFLGELRLIKSPFELKQIQKAIDITMMAHRRAIKKIRPLMFEYQVQAEIEYIFLRKGAQRPAFTSIVGSGRNSCILHYSSNRRKMRAGELVVVDIGAEYNRYAADITRTIPVSGKFSKRQKEIYNLVLGAQNAALQVVRPGISLRDIHRAVVNYFKAHKVRQYFFHGTSHWLGLDVHDQSPYNLKLKPGMVITVEPGLYLAKEQIGVRIEDDVLVTKDGYRILSGALPRSVKAIEALMKKK